MHHALTLRRLLQGPTPSAPPRAVADLLGSTPADVTALITLAVPNRSAAWASRAIRNTPELCELPVFQRLHEAAAAESFNTLLRFSELDWLLGELNPRGVDCIVLKGPQLADAIYPDPALRPYGDVDILIRERDLELVSDLLRERGYSDANAEDPAHRLHHCHGIFQRIFDKSEPFPSTIEVHCDHLQIGLEPVGMDEAWDRSTPVQFGRGHARVLDYPDLFVQLCVHLHRHGFNRLIWFKDLDLLLRRDDIDWDLAIDLARREGCLASVAYTTWLLRGVLGTHLPPELDRLASRSTLSHRLMRMAWPRSAVMRLQPRREMRLRRAVQFEPESSLLRGSVASLLFTGRRTDKLRVLGSALTARESRRPSVGSHTH